MMPLAVAAYTATSAMGHGLAAQRETLESMRSGLRPNDFGSAPLACWIGRVDGLEQAALPAEYAPWECRNNRLAWLGLNQDGFLARVQQARQRHGANRIGLFVAAEHPLAARPPTRQDLEAAVWVMREPGSGTRDHLEAGLRQSGVAPETLRIRLDLPSNEAALEAVETGALVTGVSELAAASRVRAGTVRRLDWPLPPRAFTLLTHRARSTSRATSAFIAALQAP